MTNKDIASIFKLTAKLLELHDENVFKVKAYQSAVFNLERIEQPLATLTLDELSSIENINKNTASKIVEITETGSFSELEKLLENTPSGVIELLEIPGIGPKKVRTIWKELNVTSKQALLEACNENKIAALKGFGEKTQQTILTGLAFLNKQEGKFLFAEVESYATSLLTLLQKEIPNTPIALAGQISRKLEVIDAITIIIGSDTASSIHYQIDQLPYFKKNTEQSSPFIWRGTDTQIGIALEFKIYPCANFKKEVFINSSSIQHLKLSLGTENIYQIVKNTPFESEEKLYDAIGLHYIIPEAREGYREHLLIKEAPLPEVIENAHLKGVLHNHSTYSDGKNTVLEMAEACIARGYDYFGISDHSVTASYAGGLDIDRVEQQQREIDTINSSLKNFTVFKGIESDILNDGSLDYTTEILKTFDFIVASIHSNLKMDEETATNRLLKAIENPYTTFLGHATGRLLLKREGYPLNFHKIIDACAANGVIIEINANPRRLDIDWRWMDYILNKNVLLSINPDAHIITGIDDMQYGVNVARKALVPKEMVFNTKTTTEVADYFKHKK